MDIPDDAALRSLATELGKALHAQHRMLATAESCTGGWVAKVLTDIPGSSAWFDRGFITYTNQAKQDLLEVPLEVLESQGAVSQETVEAMAQGALSHSQAHFSLAITGIAGPGGGTGAGILPPAGSSPAETRETGSPTSSTSRPRTC